MLKWWKILPVIGILITGLFPAAAAEAGRQTLELDGVWELLPCPGLGEAPEAGTQRWLRREYRIGGFYPFGSPNWSFSAAELTVEPACCWYRKRIVLPPEFRGRRLRLRFEGAGNNVRVYFNGNEAGRNRDTFAPFECDVTAAARFDMANELLVGCEGFAFCDFNRTVHGNCHSWTNGIWQPVRLIATPAVYIADVFVRTSVAKKFLKVEVTLKNTGKQSAAVILENEVEEQGRRVKRLNSVPVTIPPGREVKVEAGSVWRDPQLWSPESPHLYRLVSRLAGGDRLTTRFGFREFTASGPDLYLNGRKIRLRGRWFQGKDFWLDTFTRPWDGRVPTEAAAYARYQWNVLKKLGCNTVRLQAIGPHPEPMLAAADETGMLVISELPFFQAPRWDIGPDDAGELAAYRRATRSWVLARRNHPSIVIWSGGNEQDARNATIREFCADQIAVVRGVDPDRLVQHSGFFCEFFGTQRETPGVAETMLDNIHYPEYNSVWPEFSFIADFPTGFVRALEQFRRGRPVRPLLLGEQVWVNHIDPGLYGDRWYTDRSGSARQAWFDTWQLVLEANRSAGVALTTLNYPHPVQEHYPAPGRERLAEDNPIAREIAGKLLTPEGIFVREHWPRAFGGAPLSRTVMVWNETPEDREYEVELVLSSSGTEIWRKQFPAEVPAGETKAFPVALPLPECGLRREFTLALTLRGGAAPRRFTTYLEAFPRRQPRSRSGEPLALYDPAGRTARVFTRAGIPFRRLAVLEKLGESGCRTTVIGAGAFTKKASAKEAETMTALAAYSARGNDLICLEQKVLPSFFPLKLDLQNTDKTVHSTSFRREREHPVLAGLRRRDLWFWAGDHAVCRAIFSKPAAGNFTILTDATFGHGGLTRTPLIELRHGRGRLLFSQYLLIEKFDSEPIAALLLENLLDYCAFPAASAPENRPGVLTVRDSAFARLLDRELGIASMEDETLPRASGCVIAEGRAVTVERARGLKQFVEAGGTLLISQTGPECEEALRLLTGRTVHFVELPLPCDGFVPDEITRGLAGFNVCYQQEWKNQDSPYARRRQTIRVPLCAGLEPLGGGGALARVRAGRGRIIFDQYPWPEYLTGGNRLRALNYISILLTNLGVRLTDRYDWLRALPRTGAKELRCRPPLLQERVSSDGFVMSWLLCGPFPNDPFRHGRTDYLARIGGERFAEPKEGDAVEVKFPASPHWHTGKARLQWRAGSFTEAGIDLAGSLTCAGLGLTRPVFCAGYAAAYLYSPKRRDCLLALGSDDGCRAWLNHREIGNAVEKLRGAAPDQELFPVTLQPGCNLLLLKIDQHTGGWGFYCRFLDRDRRPVTDLLIAF